MSRRAWFHVKLQGPCPMCRRRVKLYRHHVLYEQHVKAEHGDPWDPANMLGICRDCHQRHHDAVERIRFDVIPQPAIDFATRLFGVEKAALYFTRYYNTQPNERRADAYGLNL